MEGFYENERVMPKGSDERRREVSEMIKKPAATKPDPSADVSDEELIPDELLGTVIETTSGHCKVSTGGEVINCLLRGILQKEETGYSNVVAGW